MNIEIRPYTAEKIDDVLQFESDLRKEEDFWGWEIDEDYKKSVAASFADSSFLIPFPYWPMLTAGSSAGSTVQ